MLMDMKLNDFAALLASKEPAPGGGSVSALAGVMAAALGQMTVNLTVGKKAYEALEESVKQEIRTAGNELSELRKKLTKLVDEDTLAFTAYMAAMKMPKTTDMEKSLRKAAMDAAGEEIIKVPFRTMEACFEVLPHLQTVAKHGNKNCASDVAVAANMAYSGIEGARLNVLINKPEGEKHEDMFVKMAEFLLRGRTLHSEIYEMTEENI